MANKILVALDESKNSMKTVHYVGQTMPHDAAVTILSILPDPASACEMDSPSLTPLFKENAQAFCSLEATKKEHVEQFMKQAKETLVGAGFSAKNVGVRVRKKKKGIARDILKEAQQGGYDTVVLGRRGVSGVKDFLFGSVSQKVVQLAVNMAVVVVD